MMEMTRMMERKPRTVAWRKRDHISGNSGIDAVLTESVTGPTPVEGRGLQAAWSVGSQELVDLKFSHMSDAALLVNSCLG
jgi:hypothetical protein